MKLFGTLRVASCESLSDASVDNATGIFGSGFTCGETVKGAGADRSSNQRAWKHGQRTSDAARNLRWDGFLNSGQRRHCFASRNHAFTSCGNRAASNHLALLLRGRFSEWISGLKDSRKPLRSLTEAAQCSLRQLRDLTTQGLQCAVLTSAELRRLQLRGLISHFLLTPLDQILPDLTPVLLHEVEDLLLGVIFGENYGSKLRSKIDFDGHIRVLRGSRYPAGSEWRPTLPV